MNNKGFSILESLVATSVIIILFIALYTYIVQIIDNYNARNKYDLVENTYKLNTIRTYIYAYGNVNDIIYDDVGNNRNSVSIKNLNFNNTDQYNDIYGEMLEDMGIEKIYFVYSEYDSNGQIDTSKINISDNNLYKYVMYVGNKYRYKYRIVAKFENEEYSQIKLWKVSG